jgi:hypothetical protein
MSLEMELFNFGEVRITDKSVRVRERAFSMESLIGVEVLYRNRSWSPVLMSLMASIVCEVAGHSVQNVGLHIAALVFLIMTATLFWNGGPRYTIALDTAEGYFMPMTSADRLFVESIAQVVGKALRNDTQYAPVRKPAASIVQMPAFQLVTPKPQRLQVAFGSTNLATALHPSTHAKLFCINSRATHKAAV